jgi:hypothetical protein
MADDRITDADFIHRGADLVHPPRVLVPESTRQVDGHRGSEPTVPDVQIGTAQPRPTDPDDDVVRASDRRLRHFIESGTLTVGVQPDSLHGYLPGDG